MKNKKRAICAFCKAKKYLKYLDKGYFYKNGETVKWSCKNSEKCNSRGANYKK